ncbi:RNA polymerase sigma factor, sigma-70 family [Actinopolyspora xinjiangensis]|uniref:RNA polymerase sigma factor, sigma-70 family n=1 Tax=Actinopolyspora xinjiangensis TaxID=405564 RepID=A0A1H0W7H9_9ACTN|nr:sigma-70 family RNA polymerase sigma factor [Actinopolyspora xinjiangensis]SDP86700.1 RNA polymerase sigma factor, sigma-70 family [Actinopolyspora xinjiangensis]
MTEQGRTCGTAALLDRVALGDERAWRDLVDRNSGVVWGAVRAYSANRADAEDAWQATWLLLAENLHRLRDAEGVSAWLVTTARRESLRLARARRRESPSGLAGLLAEVDAGTESPESSAVRSVSAARMAQAFAQLSQRCQQLLRIMAVAPDASYEQIGAALGLARGSIGPKKQRCLRALRQRMLVSGSPDSVEGVAG